MEKQILLVFFKTVWWSNRNRQMGGYNETEFTNNTDISGMYNDDSNTIFKRLQIKHKYFYKESLLFPIGSL